MLLFFFFFLQVLLRSSVYLTLSVYCACSLLAAVAAWALPIETAGRALQESSQLNNNNQDTNTSSPQKASQANYGSQNGQSQGPWCGIMFINPLFRYSSALHPGPVVGDDSMDWRTNNSGNISDTAAVLVIGRWSEVGHMVIRDWCGSLPDWICIYSRMSLYLDCDIVLDTHTLHSILWYASDLTGLAGMTLHLTHRTFRTFSVILIPNLLFIYLCSVMILNEVKLRNIDTRVCIQLSVTLLFLFTTTH